MPRGMQDEPGQWSNRYANNMNRIWEPSREPNERVLVDSAFTSWRNTVGQRNTTTVHGERCEREIPIPLRQRPHLLNQISRQIQTIDDERLVVDEHEDVYIEE